MGLLNKIFGKKADNKFKSVYDDSSEHAVLISFYHYESEELDELFELDDKLRVVIKEKSLGKYDGHEINMDGPDGTLFMYGPDAEKLFIAIRPILKNIPFMRGAVATLRFGSSKYAKTIEVEI
jgi:hypothetical protein